MAIEYRPEMDDRAARAMEIVRVLKGLFPEARTALQYRNHWELLAAVILSAQCTDKKVNEVTARLFTKYSSLSDYVTADIAEFEMDIRQTGFFRNKAKNILASAKIVHEQYGGKIPETMDELLNLPGVARKTANVVLGSAYGIVDGIAVDTHVRRLSIKLGLTDNKRPEQIERDLMRLLPKSEWLDFSHRLILYGRTFCPARRHDCKHPLTRIYPPAADIWP